MGLLVDGVWRDQWYDTAKSGGRFEREASRFRRRVSAAADDEFPAESGRYHLYVSLACPWAHRTLIFRKLKGLEPHISVSVVSPDMMDNGWEFDAAKGLPDHLYGVDFMYQLYLKAHAQYSGRVTVPVLWDKQSQTIVNNESAEIIRMFNDAFNDLTGNHADFYPEPLRERIDAVNEWVYAQINNGVYRCGFATTQEAYEEAFSGLFAALDRVEEILAREPFLAGEFLTEADWRLFTTLIRFDTVYYGHFKCNLRRIADFPNLSQYMRQLYQHEHVAETVNLAHIKRHYYYSHVTINPTRIVPVGPECVLNGPHDCGPVRVMA
ncbi:glutathione S-transferase family protein [Hahella sp. NBU794]|uniref:glutathione S-transferase family protein n=1 Tax=Hahella sp. NBU794 TaxID=3422590 RepID=UPI003D6F36EC